MSPDLRPLRLPPRRPPRRILLRPHRPQRLLRPLPPMSLTLRLPHWRRCPQLRLPGRPRPGLRELGAGQAPAPVRHLCHRDGAAGVFHVSPVLSGSDAGVRRVSHQRGQVRRDGQSQRQTVREDPAALGASLQDPLGFAHPTSHAGSGGRDEETVGISHRDTHRSPNEETHRDPGGGSHRTSDTSTHGPSLPRSLRRSHRIAGANAHDEPSHPLDDGGSHPEPDTQRQHGGTHLRRNRATDGARDPVLCSHPISHVGCKRADPFHDAIGAAVVRRRNMSADAVSNVQTHVRMSMIGVFIGHCYRKRRGTQMIHTF
mmetsp:Transcript_1346/g.2726  ORF Transcript_1346/g.2726 Transcript_1346/m.2726 type:complete len:315 (+) Transcript_1346:1136-2080(+)